MAGAFSMLAETAEEFIQLECARRRNQASLKRRPSLPSQFHVSGHKSRLKEKLAQARRHAFLLRSDNKAALVGIIDTVRELANYGEEGGSKSSSQRNNGPSPLERDRFMSWAADVEKLLIEFEPSENHANDPLLRTLEYLQFLQDGHVCLAEVAMDARALLERWDRSGVFDSESSSEDDEYDDGNDSFLGGSIGFLTLSTAKDNTRHIEKSYAYQSIRQRAAASIIKRNVLTWVRSKASFCDRVAEIEIFGRTTEALLKELSLTSAGLIGAGGNGSTDIFALATGRCDPKSRYNGTIAFKDLLQFSKHLALFPVDQALRTVEDVTRRRYLFDARCAMKIQAVWRQVRETVRARRLRRAMEELHLQREQEAQAKREAAKQAKKRKASEAGKRKVTKALKRSSTTRSSVIASALPSLLSTTDEGLKEPLKELSPPENREATGDTNEKRKPLSRPVPPIDVSNRTRGDIFSIDDRSKPLTSTPRSRQRASRVPASNNNDSDDDTTDVEAAWRSFMDTVATDMAVQEATGETEVNAATEERFPSSPMPPATLPAMDDTWESWSDDETDLGNKEKQENDAGDSPTAAKPGTPLVSTAPTPQMKVVVSANKSNLSDPVARHASHREPSTPRRHQTRAPTTSSSSAIRPPSSLPFDATLQNHTGPYTGAGQLSMMAPFIDADRSKKTQPVVVPQRKHLYELDFTSAQRNDASIVHIATALTGATEPQVQAQLPRPKTREIFAVAPGSAVDTPRASSRRTTVAKLRSITGEHEQYTRIRELIDSENRDSKDQQDTSARAGNNTSTGYFIYGAQDVNIRREVVQRKETMVYSPLTGPPEEEPPNSTALGVKEMKSWHRSTIAAIPQALAAPHPPTDRFHPRHKRRLKGPQRKTISTEIMDQTMAVEPPTSITRKRVEKNNELPLLLRRSRAAARRREAARLDVLPDDDEGDHLDTPAPDANKQMWKRGGDLPELALAQIRDRVGYKQRSSTQKRMSIIAGRAPPFGGGQSEDNNSVAASLFDHQPETIFPVDEEELGEEDEEDPTSDDEEDATSEDEVDYNPEETHNDEDNPEVDGDVDHQNSSSDANGLQRHNSMKSDELNDEFRRLHLASLERELTRRRSLLSHLQSKEDAVVSGIRRQSKDGSPQSRKRSWRRRSQVATGGETSEVTGLNEVEATTVATRRSSDEDLDVAKFRRRLLRIKTREAIADPFEMLSDDDDEGGDEERVVGEEIVGMTQQERDAAFQKLLTQYLGLLQCAPAEVARRLQVNDSCRL
ncbi:uncharacterized protein KRP23_5342 [Phytophthora ramorum]|uniref:uncharacterized protein n=1 Tax=Phytophthora ramorum TaxID=164328 RepID=UPI00309785B1|nr:hypothetical protein KRP23_5342 [Phytophthora ramorum]